MGVSLSGLDIGVAQQSHDFVEVRSLHHQAACERVTKVMPVKVLNPSFL